jgi:PAS domain S-box-containing protein
LDGKYLEANMAYSTPSDQLGTLRIKADESEDYFRRVFENAATGIVIADANRGYLAVNDRFCAITGYDRETLLTMGCHQLVHPDDQAADIAEVERLVRGEATSFNRELRYIHANGSTVPVIVNVSVLKSDARERVRILAVVEDITERKQMEEALLESEKKYRTLVEQSDDGIAIVRDGVLVYVNPRLASLYGGTVELLTGSQVTDHLDAKDMKKVTEMRRRRLNGEEVPSRYEVALRRRNGQIFQAELNVGMIIYQGRSAAQVTIRDITERKLAEEAVKREKKLQEGINRILQEAITCDTEEQLGIVCLSVAGELTKSRIGFIGEIRPDGNLYDIAMSNPTWELCAMYDQSGHRRPPGQFALHGLYGYVLQQGKSLLTNTPAQHPQSIGIPKGHPPLSSFLGVPRRSADT